jgi:hypothetical protein
MKFVDEQLFQEKLIETPAYAKQAQEIAEYVEHLVNTGSSIESALNTMFDKYYESTYWETFDNACVILSLCWKYGEILRSQRSKRYA